MLLFISTQYWFLTVLNSTVYRETVGASAAEIGLEDGQAEIRSAIVSSIMNYERSFNEEGKWWVTELSPEGIQR